MSDRPLFEMLRMTWDRSRFEQPPATEPIQVVLLHYQRGMSEIVWDAAQLEGNPFTFVEVETLMDGVTVGGHKISDEAQVQGLIDSTRLLHKLVTEQRFTLSDQTGQDLYLALARREAFDAGMFRGEGKIVTNISVSLGERGVYQPTRTEPGGSNLVEEYQRGLDAVREIENPLERAVAFKAYVARGQFFYDRNKRLSRHLMNGELMSHGVRAISVPARKRQLYNTAMVDLYATGNAGPLFALLDDIHQSRDIS